MEKKINKRLPNEYKIVTDGIQLYRLSPIFDTPKDTIQIFTHESKNIYSLSGKLKSKFCALTRIQPRNNQKHLLLCIKSAIAENQNAN